MQNEKNNQRTSCPKTCKIVNITCVVCRIFFCNFFQHFIRFMVEESKKVGKKSFKKIMMTK